MYSRLIAAVASVLLWAAPSVPAATAQSGAEAIRSYDVMLAVEGDGAVVVSETIRYDFGTNRRHGIYRDIPVRLRYDKTHDRVYPFELLSVRASPGTPDRYEVESSGGNRRIRVGDPDRTVTGTHTYTVRYRMRAVLNGFADHDELFWNAVGAEWDVPVERTSVRVTVPAGVPRVACYAGPTGSRLPCSEATAAEGSATFSHGLLAPRQAVTVVVGFPSGSVPPPRPILEERWSLGRAFSVTPLTVLGSLLVLALGLAAFVRLAWRHGRDRRWAGLPVDAVYGNQDGVEQPVALFEDTPTPMEYEPPDGLRPGQVGTLVDEAANPLDVTATVVDLAVRGFLRIEEIPRQGWFGKPDWNLARLRHDDEGLREYERLLLDGLFESGDEVKLSELRNTFVARLRKVQGALYRDVVAQGWFRAPPDRVRLRWVGIGVAVVVVGAALLAAAVAWTEVAWLAVPVVLVGVVFVVGARRMPHRTAKGTAALRRVQGFRRFLRESDPERYRFAERQNLFEEYLPYAVVFGCTEKWARAFEGLDRQPPAPGWYVGSRPFTVGHFSEAVDGFTVAGAGTIASTPGGSGGSRFGGGAGGGGGGGGGGSW